MTPYHSDPWLTVWQGDCREVMAQMEPESVHCVVTSPPYWGLRDYGTATWLGGDEGCDHKRRVTESTEHIKRGGYADAFRNGSSASNHREEPAGRDVCPYCGAVREDKSLGLEPTPEEYVANMVAVFREVRRVLRADGTCWVNLGDSYATNGAGAAYGWTNGKTSERDAATIGSYKAGFLPPGLKPKDLVGIPWMVARALQAPYYTGRIAAVEDRAWLAAAIDGEGCIYIQRRPAGTVTGRVKRDGSRSGYSEDQYQPGLRFTNTSEAFVRRVAERAGVGNVRSRSRDGQRPYFEWSCYSQEARDLLRELYPHLVAKQHEARLAIGCQPTGGGAAWEALKAIHHGSGSDVDFPAPPSLYEPGWYLRSDIIWAKPNPMPESVTDRPTKAHEYLFLLSKSARYFYDADAVREEHSPTTHPYAAGGSFDRPGETWQRDGITGSQGMRGQDRATYRNPAGRNLRSVWSIATQPYPGAHFATFPEALVEPCVKAGTSERGVCPECGAPWRRVVERERTDSRPGLDVKLREITDGNAARTGRGGDYITRTTAWQPSCSCNEVPNDQTVPQPPPLSPDSMLSSRLSRSGGHLAGRSFADAGPMVPDMRGNRGEQPSDEATPTGLALGAATVLDPFAGSGTTGRVAQRLGRRAVLIDLNGEYLTQTMKRNADIPLGLEAG